MSLWHVNIKAPTLLGGWMVLRTSDHLIGPFPPGAINRHSHVLVAICEVSQPEGQPLDFPFMGAATMTVHNVCPRDDNFLNVRLTVDWNSPLNCRLKIAILD